ncbi:MAG TPA: RecX family transcriptional regulator [Candidatus Marinimicrobia bacterium]|nr:RecX family transcriptional regulator [Candidatus Neomarinimicrobiota bacterium]HRS51276.1 RecX family transcriptional regulator [Candidatus Neomarinimicrobiota bacterium]HRU91486.1 RecX family transcriptional regulator [Candidatus Neomarinimicrobiota bacterium]
MSPDFSPEPEILKVVTKIESQKRKSARINIYLDNEFAFGIGAETFNLFRVSVGQQLTEKQIRMIQQHELFEQAKEAAIKYLGLRMRSQKELELYLNRRKKYPLDVTSRVIKYCIERGYLDDKVFCETFIRDQLQLSHNGVQKIRQALIAKGVTREVIDEAIKNLVKDEDQLEAALLVGRKKASSLKNDPKSRDKLYRYLIQKGYKPNVVIKALQKIP